MLPFLLLFALAQAHDGPEASLARLDVLVASEPSVAAHRVQRADLYRRAGEPLRALIEVEQALALGATAEAWLVAAEAHRDLGDWDEAEAAATRALPDDEAWALRAGIRAARGDAAGALSDWDAAIGLRATPDRVLARGRLAEASGDLDRAAEGYAQGIAALDGAVALRLALLDLERRRGRLAAALAQADALLAIVPDHPEWLLLRSAVQADPAAARLDLERALAVIDGQIAVRPTEQRQALRTAILAAREAQP